MRGDEVVKRMGWEERKMGRGDLLVVKGRGNKGGKSARLMGGNQGSERK